MSRARIVANSQILAHVPDLVLSGSKPSREISHDPEVADAIQGALQSTEEAAAYLPNRVFIGAAEPRPLIDPEAPWWDERGTTDSRVGDFGALFSQSEFLASMRAVDSVGLLSLNTDPEFDPDGLPGSLVGQLEVERQHEQTGQAEPIRARDGTLGTMAWGYPDDAALAPHVVFENLAAKASGALALRHALVTGDIDPERIDLVISASEEAIGDRYQRGGGNLGKAIAEAVGADNASGFDVKNFCAAPIPGLVVASSLIEAGVVDSVAVVAGGSVPKLGMKFQGHLKSDMPILEDCLGAVAVVLQAGDEGPMIRHDAVGRHSVAAGGSNPQIFGELVFGPLERAGLKIDDVGLFGTELHNPELTEPQGSGNVPLRNYRLIGALAARREHIAPGDVDRFLTERCVGGFAPTQGHIASAICLLPHVLRRMKRGELQRAQLVAKGSLFLGRMSALSDGMSVIVEPGG